MSKAPETAEKPAVSPAPETTAQETEWCRGGRTGVEAEPEGEEEVDSGDDESDAGAEDGNRAGDEPVE